MNSRRFVLLSSFALLLFAPPAWCQNGADPYAARTKAGDRMPAISVDGASGPFSIAADKGKVVVVNLLGYMVRPLPGRDARARKQVWEKYKSSPDFAFIAIAREQDKDTVLKFQKSHPNFTFPFAWDPKREAYKLFAEGGIPRTYVVDRHGIIVFQNMGIGPDGVADVDRAVQKALAEK